MLSLFKLGDDYYVFLKYNAGLSDDGSLSVQEQLDQSAKLDSAKYRLKEKQVSKAIVDEKSETV